MADENEFEKYGDRRFRIVSDYGWGDKSWLERMLTAEQAWTEIQRHTKAFDNLDQAISNDFNYTYYVEEDNENDEEDWDWMSS